MEQKLIQAIMGEAAKSNVEKRQVGCIIVDQNKNILAKGYNTEDIHAEVMACEDLIASAVETKGLNLHAYVTHKPCPNCADLLVQHNISDFTVVEAFMKFDTEKPRFDLVTPDLVTYLCEDAPIVSDIEQILLTNGDANTEYIAEIVLTHLNKYLKNPGNDILYKIIATINTYYISNFEPIGKYLLLEDIAKVLTFGASKYKPNNWRNCQDTGRYVAASYRHTIAILQESDSDSETNLLHLAHIATNIMFLLTLGYKNDY